MKIRKNSIVSSDELDNIYEQMIQKAKEKNLNAYEAYIEECKLNSVSKINEAGNPLPGIEKHHIVPRFDGGLDVSENIVLLTVKEHVIAHWLRWKVLKKSQDHCAFLFRIGDTEAALAQRRQSVLEARERDKSNQKGFFDPEFQREMGTRGGSTGGSRGTLEQLRARQQVGLTYGRDTGISNQGEPLQEFVSKFSIWAYSAEAAKGKRRADRSDEQFFLVAPKEAFTDTVRVLNTFAPASVRNASSLHKVVYKDRNQMYGWRIVNTLTRSEVKEGIQNFIDNNPTLILCFEEDLMLGEGFE